MLEERAARTAKWQEDYRVWNTPVNGRPLNEIVRGWHNGDEEATQSIAAFMAIPENYRLARRVEGLIGQGPFFPGNNPDFNKLPEGLACTMCPAFKRVVSVEPGSLTVQCEWPRGLETVKMALNSSVEGGAFQIQGNCKQEFGISK